MLHFLCVQLNFECHSVTCVCILRCIRNAVQVARREGCLHLSIIVRAHICKSDVAIILRRTLPINCCSSLRGNSVMTSLTNSNRTLIASNLSPASSEDTLLSYFTQFGEIESGRIETFDGKPQFRVRYSSPVSASIALNSAQHQRVDGYQLELKYEKDKSKAGSDSRKTSVFRPKHDSAPDRKRDHDLSETVEQKFSVPRRLHYIDPAFSLDLHYEQSRFVISEKHFRTSVSLTADGVHCTCGRFRLRMLCRHLRAVFLKGSSSDSNIDNVFRNRILQFAKPSQRSRLERQSGRNQRISDRDPIGSLRDFPTSARDPTGSLRDSGSGVFAFICGQCHFMKLISGLT